MNLINENVTNSERNNEYLRIVIFHNYSTNKNMNLKKEYEVYNIGIKPLTDIFFHSFPYLRRKSLLGLSNGSKIVWG